MRFRSPHHPDGYDTDWADNPAQGAFPQYVGGFFIPLLIAGFGVYGLATGNATLSGNRATWELHGRMATALSIAYIGVGLFLHSHYFWGNIFDQHWLAVLGKIFGLIAFIGGMGYVIVHGFIG